jgi:hypothetical protein
MLQAGDPIWIELELPKGLRRVTRCDEDGTVSAEGGHFVVR